MFEHFLQTKFLGAKRFSLEGAESVIPIARPDHRARRRAPGVTQIVIGMAHRGRLNVLANVLGKPPAEIFAEFLDRATDLSRRGRRRREVPPRLLQRSGDRRRAGCTSRWPSTPATSSG